MEQPADRPAAGGLLHHLLTLTLAGGYFLLPTPAVTNCFHFQKWGALCCPDFPLVPCPQRGIWHQRQAETLLSTDKSTKYCAKNKGKLVFLSNFYDYYNALSGEYRSATISTVKCSELEAVAEETAKLFDQYRSGISSLDVTTVKRYFRFNDHWFYDFKDYMDILCGKSETAALAAALQKAVIAKYTTGLMITLEIDPARFSGLSSYINNPEEETLTKFYQKYAWNDAVKMIVPETSSED